MASRNASMDQTSVTAALATPYVWIYSIAIGLFLVFVWMALVNVVFMYGVWPPNAGLREVTEILERDAAIAPQPLANRLADWSYAASFGFSGIHDLVIAATTPDTKLSALDAALVNGFLTPHAEGVAILMQSIRLVGIRVALLTGIIAVALPLFSSVLIDGLSQRYVRRECAGRESSGLYHRAKYLQFIGGLVVAMLYVTVPLAINPHWLFAWMAVAALLVFLQTKFYKKYL